MVISFLLHHTKNLERCSGPLAEEGKVSEITKMASSSTRRG
jgi:hypothetical protein